MALRAAEIIESRVQQTASIIFLHGLGDDGSGWADGFKQIAPPYCKIICPNAYDLFGLDVNARQDEDGIASASTELSQWVEAEIKAGIPAERILVGGFSQGGSVALSFGVKNAEFNLAGLLAMSCWLPLHDQYLADQSIVKANRSLPILQCHGQMDPVVSHDFGAVTNSVLKQFGFTNCTLKSYSGMGHSSNTQEMDDVKEFLYSCLPPK